MDVSFITPVWDFSCTSCYNICSLYIAFKVNLYMVDYLSPHRCMLTASGSPASEKGAALENWL